MADMAGMRTMAMSSATLTGGAAAATTTAAMSMGGMSMGDGACKISMLWNWYTIDACFLAKTWQIKSNGAFAGSCIGVILLVMVLEALRRGAKEYDAFLIRKRTQAALSSTMQRPAATSTDSSKNLVAISEQAIPAAPTSFRPTFLEQNIRALLHMLQFAVAYFIMLLAMYYNGYIIICIFIGAYIGAFVFNWTSLGLGNESREITFCCG